MTARPQPGSAVLFAGSITGWGRKRSTCHRLRRLTVREGAFTRFISARNWVIDDLLVGDQRQQLRACGGPGVRRVSHLVCVERGAPVVCSRGLAQQTYGATFAREVDPCPLG